MQTFFTWDDLLDKAPEQKNANYPEWYQQKYFYKLLAGAHAKTGLTPNGIQFGYFEQEKNTVSPAHSHPAAEMYFIMEGTAEWWVNDEKQHVAPGSLIFHQPNATHGWVSGQTGPLKALWIWWKEQDQTPEVLKIASQLVNPNRDTASEKTAKPFA